MGDASVLLDMDKIQIKQNLERTYDQWLEVQKQAETQAKFIYLFSNVFLPILHLYYYPEILFFTHFSKCQVCFYIIFLCFAESLFFVCSHAMFHWKMEYNWDLDQTIVFPYAFYHHYVPKARTIYSVVPYSFRMYSSLGFDFVQTTAGIIIFITMRLSGGQVGGGAEIVCQWFWLRNIFAIDTWIHEYLHTSDVKYNSGDPFSAKFKGLYFIGKVLEKMGVINVEMHRRSHHEHDVDSQDEVHDWVDLKFPFLWRIADYFGIYYHKLGRSLTKNNIITFFGLDRFFSQFVMIFLAFVSKYLFSWENVCSEDGDGLYNGYFISQSLIFIISAYFTKELNTHKSVSSGLHRNGLLSIPKRLFF